MTPPHDDRHPRPPDHVARHTIVSHEPDPMLRGRGFSPPRRRWPGLLVAGLIAAGITALAVSSFYDDRTVGEKLDIAVQATQRSVRSGVADLKGSADMAARGGARATDRTGSALSDAGITAAVKTSLAADPTLSALKIDVDTVGGVVSLQGPAPDERSRERAEVLAAAPNGVQRVDNRLVVASAPPVGR